MKDIEITGIDREKDLIELARTGYRVHSQVEKERQDFQGTSVAGSRWRFYFVPEGPPPNFAELVKDSPRLEQITRDPVIEGGVIGDKLEWNRIKGGMLPKTDFVHETLEKYVATHPVSRHQRQIYVLANSWGYMMVKDAKNPANMQVAFDDSGKKMQFFKVISDIKKNNSGKEVILVVSEIERQILENFPNKGFLFSLLGMKPFSVEEMQKIGMVDPNRQRLLKGRIWRIDT